MARFVLPLIFALGAAAQSVAYTDPNTDIDFMSYYDSDTQTRWSVATPETLGTDLIIQMVAPTTKGWTGFDLGTTMENKLLVVAWPNGDEVMSSFREASGYTSPSVYSGNVTATPIANGTFVNSTHFSYTFVCGGCITGDSVSFLNTASGNAFGWAYSETAPTTPSSASTALTYHAAGFGAFSIIFANSSSASYETWASWASASTTTSTSSASTSVSSSTNSTTTVSSNSTTTASNTIATTVSNTTYDYIIAGAGPAGIIVAERLSESGAEVLLIERGGASTYSSGGKAVQSWNDTVTQYDVPATSQYLLSGANDTSEWCTDTADEAGCLLGGGSEINALNFVRPQDADFENWPQGWNWADVSSAAEKLYARNPGTISPSMDGKHYDQGVYDIVSGLFAGNGWTSVNAIEEPNKKHNVYSYPPWSIANGERAGPVKTYLPLAQARSNFHLQLNTTVVRAVRNDSYISGVEVQLASGARQIINVNAGGKVILAGGVYSTPRILINSGIGPSDQIKIVQSGNVQVTLPDESEWISLPVGKNIMDHPKLPILFKTSSSLSALSEDDILQPSQYDIDLFAQGSGVLTQSSQRLAFYSSVEGSDGKTRFIEGTCTAPSNDTIKIQIYLTHGLTSTGEVGMTADGATEYITQPWLNTQADKDAFTTFLDRLLSYTRAANSTLTLDTSEGISANATGADLLTNVVSGNHYVGSARMGTDDGRKNGSAVVDADTKVYGTDNLFVVDASMHPDLPTGNTQAIIMVAAEAAAARILNVATNSTSVSVASASASVSAGTSTAVASAAFYSNTTVSSTAVVTLAPSITTQAQVFSTSSFDGAAFTSAIGNLTSALPTGVLTSTLSTAIPTATAGVSANVTLPHKALPADLTLEDLLIWVEYLLAETAYDIEIEKGQ